MVKIGIRELKNATSEVITRVEHGEVVTVTRRGKEVAKLMPVGVPEGIARLIAEGRATWSGRTPRLPDPIRLSGEGPTAADYVSEGRG
jgi:prevent-host-death family protein